jgi:D-glycero-D-manno-heptose 1,7-bisphosphate phosphatase
LIPGAAAAVLRINTLGIPLSVISNQSGIARGLLTERDLIPIHAKLVRELGREGASVDRIYYCPHHPTSGNSPYNIVCDCRKPKPGMLRWGAEELGIDLGRSFVVGDSVVDIQAGHAVGATAVLVLTGHGQASLEQCTRDGIVPDHVCDTIVEASDFITRTLREKHKNHA